MKRKANYLILMIVTAMIITIGTLGFFSIRPSAHMDESTHKTKLYQSVEIQLGDSLWTIAEKYADDFGCSTKDYMEQLRTVNNLSSDQIHAGAYLTIVYWGQ